jgi:hypothetical protein
MTEPIPPNRLLSDAAAQSADQLAYEKFLFDKRIALQELRLKRIEAKRLARESARSRWTNPIVVAVLGAILVGIGNAVVSVLNGKYQRGIAAAISQRQGDMESAKSERASVLEVIKLSEPDKIRARLCILLKLNQIPSEQTNRAVQSYLNANKGCDPAPSTPDPFMTSPAASAGAASAASSPAGPASMPAPIKSTWIQATLTVPGCGNSGCYLTYNVCGAVPEDMKATGNIRSSTDSFSGWGEWTGGVVVTDGTVCRSYTQHSHNQIRTVAYQFEVLPRH